MGNFPLYNVACIAVNLAFVGWFLHRHWHTTRHWWTHLRPLRSIPVMLHLATVAVNLLFVTGIL